MTVLKHIRMEFDNDLLNSHKFYEITIDQMGDIFRIRTTWGRKGGWGRPPTSQSQTKDVAGDVINAMVIFQDWVSKKQDKGYSIVREW